MLTPNESPAGPMVGTGILWGPGDAGNFEKDPEALLSHRRKQRKNRLFNKS